MSLKLERKNDHKKDNFNAKYRNSVKERRNTHKNSDYRRNNYTKFYVFLKTFLIMNVIILTIVNIKQNCSLERLNAHKFFVILRKNAKTLTENRMNLVSIK